MRFAILLMGLSVGVEAQLAIPNAAGVAMGHLHLYTKDDTFGAIPGKRPALGIAIAFLTDPWGAHIELTEGLDKI